MGELLGKQWQPRDIASELFKAGWTDAQDLQKALQVCLAESLGYDRAYNDNKDSNGNTTSRDVGIMQINITAAQIGTAVETSLYDVPTNIAAAFKLFKDRGFEPWVSFTSNIYNRDFFIKQAARGVGNFVAATMLTEVQDAKASARTLTNPVLNYEYRLDGTLSVLRTLETELKELRTHLLPVNQTRVDEILKEVSTGLNFKSQ